ncbi:MAG: MgtC/SapB family protein [Phycisphaerales bacterium]|nr:MgtC/SapB family protein [Phycisphaerae bacterium]NNF43234.1 MgtC/SapB family protein [Phycisphaerales bacterium]NNM25947.1 MgtC/SapB family protein [Phycisphaerales bacterium]
MTTLTASLTDLAALAAALVCSAVIGWDRESEGRAAGLRTHMMVGLGAAGFTITAWRLLEVAGGDPGRMTGAIVGGVGFLGAGSIMKAGGQVRGLTTAAGLWVVAAIGIACGLRHYDVAVFVSLLALATLKIVRRLEPAIHAEANEESKTVA